LKYYYCYKILGNTFRKGRISKLKDISEKVSYLQGLSEGLNISEGSPQGKIISGMLNVLNEIAEELTSMQQDFEEIKDYVESIDDDLFELEENILEEQGMELECSSCGKNFILMTIFLMRMMM
jgi:hypothetical protein